MKYISTIHRKGDPFDLFHRNGNIYLYPTVGANCGLKIGEVFVLDDIVCKFIGQKKVGLILPRTYDVYAFVALEEEYFEYDDDEYDEYDDDEY